MPAIQVPCPQCGSYRTYVLASNSTAKGIIRRRKCAGCDHRWYTRQQHEQSIMSDDVKFNNKKPQLKDDPL